MSFYPEPAFLVVGLMTSGCGAIFWYLDAKNPASRALSLCLSAIGLRLLLSGTDDDVSSDLGMVLACVSTTLEAIAIYAGVEWGHRIGKTGRGGMNWGIRLLFIFSKVLVVVYWGLDLGFLLIAPEEATREIAGVFQATPFELALFAPVLGTALVLAGIAIALLVATRIDRAESIRLRALQIASPFLLAALMVHRDYIPLTLTIGLLVFLAGSIRFLLVQAQRGHFVSQFLSQEVVDLVRDQGLRETLQRERRVLSVVFVDLRGFTGFARHNDSELVVQVLEAYYRVIGEVAANYGGTVKDHAGDGVLILVGAPIPVQGHEQQAAMLALDLIDRGAEAIRELAPELGLGIGVATGNTTIGAIRGAGRLEYVAVGNPVNLAARLSDRAKAGEVLADARTAQAIDGKAAITALQREPEPLKGFPEPIPVCALQVGSPA